MIPSDLRKLLKNERAKARRRFDAKSEHLKGYVSAKRHEIITKDLQRINEAIEATKFGRGKNAKSEAQVRAALKELQSVNKEFTKDIGSLARRNKVTEQQLNLSQRKDKATGEYGVGSRYKKEDVDRFYALTRPAWRNKPLESRNEAIMAYYGESDLSKLIENILDAYDEKVNKRKNDLLKKGLSDEEIELELNSNTTADTSPIGDMGVYEIDREDYAAI